MDKAIESKNTFMENILNRFSFNFSDKFKFSIKASLSMALAYLIPLSQGWGQASTAAITVMLIAAMGSVSESITKGIMRVIGTIIGAIVGMILIAVFPQERLLYLISLSLMVAIPLYLVRAYKGDPSIFMLTAMTMMMVFKNGEVDDVFLFGLDKTYMTIFGITVYTLVGVFIWPVDMEDTTTQSAKNLSQSQAELFLERNAPKDVRETTLTKLLESQEALEKATVDTGSASINMAQWHSIKHNYSTISSYLTLLSMYDKESTVDNSDMYITKYKTLEGEITQLLNDITHAWESKEEINVPKEISLEYDSNKIQTLSHLERASLITTVQDMKKLHNALRTLATKLNRIHSVLPTYFENENIPESSRFLWGDIEHLKGVLVSFIIFWVATLFWIMLNPPGGFMIVALATGLSVLTTFTPIKPSMLIIVFTLSFIFATFMYVAVLPNLRYGWELGIFIFVYSFVSFHLVNPKVSIFFLLGLFTLGIANEMYYDFSLFLLVLLMFYMFLMLLHIFYYIPYSTRPEHMFIVMKNRFFKLAQQMLEGNRKVHRGQSTLSTKLVSAYSAIHLENTVKQMQVWANGIPASYFDTLDKQTLLTFTQTSEKFSYLVELLYHKELEMKDNPLLKILSQNYISPSLSELLALYAKGINVVEVDAFWKDQKEIRKSIETSLAEIFEKIDFETYERNDIAALYESLSLRRSVWLSFLECQVLMETLNFNVLKQSRF